MDKILKFVIENINIINSSLVTPKQKLQSNEFDFSLHIQVKLDPQEKKIMVFVDVRIKNKDIAEPIGHFTAVFTYIIENFDEIVEANTDKQTILPKKYLDVFNSISISTLRGLMFSAFKGTILHAAILPVINPKDIVSNQIP